MRDDMDWTLNAQQMHNREQKEGKTAPKKTRPGERFMKSRGQVAGITCLRSSAALADIPRRKGLTVRIIYSNQTSQRPEKWLQYFHLTSVPGWPHAPPTRSLPKLR